MVELRADFFHTVAERAAEMQDALEQIGRFAADAARIAVQTGPGARAVARILTIRRECDGGRYRGDEQVRLRLLERSLAQGGFDYVDLEEDLLDTEDERRVVAAANAGGVTVIRSFHAPEGIPTGVPANVPAEEFAARARRTAARPSEIPKLAVYARGAADVLRILEIGAALGRERRIVIAMGPYGAPVRILAPLLGSWLSYCSDPAGAPAAPGQLGPPDLYQLYRYHELSRRTAVYAVIGNPVMHSRSPAFHNAKFRAAGADAVYVPLQLDEFARFEALSDRLGLQGVSVTLPHKAAMRVYVGASEPAVEAIGACNTALRTANRGWYGYNTDLQGFLAPLAAVFGREPDGGPRLREVRCTVIGAGGAARAVLYGLLARGADLLILNRTVARAEALAAELADRLGTPRPRAAALAASSAPLVAQYRQLLVQTTSIGMEPEEEGDPLPFYQFDGTEVAYDIVYTPPETTWLRRARRAGCAVIGGGAMFDAQAEAQSMLFLGQLRGEALPVETPPVKGMS